MKISDDKSHIVDYASSEAKSLALRKPDQTGSRLFNLCRDPRLRLFIIVSVFTVVAGISLMSLGYFYESIGLLTFLASCAILIKWLKKRFWIVMCVALFFGTSVTLGLYQLSSNTIIIQNDNNQPIKHLEIMLGGNLTNLSFRREIAANSVIKIKLRQLFYKGDLRVESGSLADGTELSLPDWGVFEGGAYHWQVRVLIDSAGKVHVIHD